MYPKKAGPQNHVQMDSRFQKKGLLDANPSVIPVKLSTSSIFLDAKVLPCSFGPGRWQFFGTKIWTQNMLEAFRSIC